MIGEDPDLTQNTQPGPGTWVKSLTSTIIHGAMTIVEGFSNPHLNIDEVSADVYRIKSVRIFLKPATTASTPARLLTNPHSIENPLFEP